MLRRFVVALCASCTLCHCLTATPWQEFAETDAPLYDHHVHVLSPELIAHWKVAGMPFSREERAYTDPLHILESQNLEGAFLVSMAHVYTGALLAANQEIRNNEQEWVQRENDFVARCVQRDPIRLAGFFSVNPLRDYSFDEMNRCREIDGLVGLKLHLPACEIDLLDPEHVKKLKQAMAWAVEHRIPVLVHIMTVDEDAAREKAHMFWNDVMKYHADVGLIVAHLGGAGGYNDISRAVLEEYEAACQSNARLRVGDTRFDLSGAVILEETDGIPATSQENCDALARHIQQIGAEHFFFASDYPVFEVADAQRGLRKKLPLTEDEFEAVFTNRHPLFTSRKELATIRLPDLRKELLEREARDQRARRALMPANGQRGDEVQIDQSKIMELMAVDKENREWLKQQVDEHGWLGRSLVGTDGSGAAWLLVQHADTDRAFQRECLDLMTAAGADEVFMKNVAYLTDRVLVGEGKPQRYGTQVGVVDGKVRFEECEDPDNLNLRRAEMGLGTIEEYLQVIREVFNLPDDDELDNDEKPDDNDENP